VTKDFKLIKISMFSIIGLSGTKLALREIKKSVQTGCVCGFWANVANWRL